jgi:uncharacterized protein
MTKSSRRNAVVQAAFWDTSAVVPLLCFQAGSSHVRQLARSYGRQIVWWITPVEAASAVQRLTREGNLQAEGASQAIARLYYLRGRWSEVQPTEELRDEAERLLRVHRLRAADAMQLAAALCWCQRKTYNRPFVAGDGALADAARIEGFNVLQI